MGSESKERDPDVRLPFPGAAFMLAEQGGKGVRNVWLWTASTFGTAGTGVRIAKLSGAARYRAALASIGKGPLSNGGTGMAGGSAKLAKVETVAGYALAAVYLGAVITANWENFKGQPAAEVPTTCGACGAPVQAASTGSSESLCTRNEGCSAQS